MSGSRSELVVAAETGRIVQTGPFAGMSVLEEDPFGVADLGPKWLGVYKQELYPCFNDMLSRPPSVILNLGCRDGFHAVGLARMFPDASVIGFDDDPAAQDLTLRNAAANERGDRVATEAECDAIRLSATANDHQSMLVLCNLNGQEMELFAAPGLAQALAKADLIIECHDYSRIGCTGRIIEQFYDTHDVFVIDQGARNPNIFPFLARLPDYERWQLMSETHPERINWVYCRPRSAPPRTKAFTEGTTLRPVYRYLRDGTHATIFAALQPDGTVTAYDRSGRTHRLTFFRGTDDDDVLMQSEAGLERIHRYEPVVWTCIFGTDIYYQCLEIFLNSLTGAGQYRGRLWLFSGRSAEETLKYVPKILHGNTVIRPLPDKPSLQLRYKCAAGLPEMAGPFLYLDSDIIFDLPLDPVLQAIARTDRICLSTEEHHHPELLGTVEEVHARQPATCEWFGLEMLMRDGRFGDSPLALINSGIIGVKRRRRLEQMFDAIQHTIHRTHPNYIRDWGDQPAVNYVMMQIGTWDREILTPAVQFAGPAPKDPGRRRGFCHFVWVQGADKYEQMRLYMNNLQRW